MMEQELDCLVKEKLELKVVQVEICIYLSTFILMIFLKDQIKIYFLNFQYQSLMQLLEQH